MPDLTKFIILIDSEVLCDFRHLQIPSGTDSGSKPENPHVFPRNDDPEKPQNPSEPLNKHSDFQKLNFTNSYAGAYNYTPLLKPNRTGGIS